MSTTGTGTPSPPGGDEHEHDNEEEGEGEGEERPFVVRPRHPWESDDEERPPDIADMPTIEMAIVELQEAMRHRYTALRDLHLAEAQRARAQAELLAAASEREPDPKTAAN
jgi:hypothetical protein